VRNRVHEALLRRAEIDALRAAVDEVEQWLAGSHRWGHYAEQTPAGPAICRTENVSACQPEVERLVNGSLEAAATAFVDEPVVAFKDKLNYKQPGGAGFRPHQDRLAYPGVEHVVSILVAIDECSVESGCLWLAGDVDELLPTDDRGVVRDDVVASLHWTAAELAAGDAVYLDGLTPHYSEANEGTSARRVLVASYAPRREGYTREQYYAARADAMAGATARDGRYRISTLADFAGTEVATEGAAPADRCSHPTAASAPGRST
jgi:hypothetical protein